MAPKAEEALRKRKDAQQKKILIALAPLLLGLLVWQGPKTYSALMGGSAAPPPPPVTTAATTTTTTSAVPLPPGTTPTPPAGGATSASNLPDSDPLLAPGAGQLIVFSRFIGKDPFREKPSSTSSTDGTDGPTGNASSASLEVNGTTEEVKIGETFPAGDPAFRLVNAGGDSAEIGLASGTFSNGQETIAVKVGETLVLISDPDGKRYAIKLVGVA
jgi:hypothetical protein